jgi:hypothetical protein
MNFLSGKKTHIVAFLLVLVGLVQGLTGDAGAWQGVLDNALIILNGLGLSALRAGVNKS